MSPEAVNYFETAKLQLQEAEDAWAGGLHRIAARLAYDVALSSARAITFEKTHQAPKTHSGVRNQLAKLEHEGLPLEDGLLKFLADGFEAKVDFDYGPFSPVSREEAEIAMARARDFLVAARKICEWPYELSSSLGSSSSSSSSVSSSKSSPNSSSASAR